MRTAAAGGATAAAALATVGLGGTSALAATKSRASTTPAPTLKDAGAGMHVGIGSVQMVACATISSALTTCAVGQQGLTLSDIPALGSFLSQYLGTIIGPGWSGIFAMEMYSYDVTSYDVNRTSGVITAQGVLRSITKMGGVLIEDANAPYLAVATDNDGRTGKPDSYFLSFTTPFWSTSDNPLATPSTFHSGWSMFGGPLIVGDISVPS